MKHVISYSKAIFATAVVAVLFTLDSCQKEQDKTPADTNQQIGTASKGGTQVNSLPDLTIDGARLQSSAVTKTKVFKSTDCAVVEGCVSGTGKRKLLRFDVATPNIGTADMVLGSPVGNPLFEFSPCHGHYHFSGYALYELRDATGSTVIVTGRKQAFCLEDYLPYYSNPLPGKFTCSNQGITVGWQDVYGSYLDCQWLDVTDVAPGNYMLRVAINPEHILTESDYSNNEAMVPVKISK